MKKFTSQASFFGEQHVQTAWADLPEEVLQAAGRLIAPDPQAREAGLSRLLTVQAHRVSPLVAYLLATRLSEPKIPLRYQVVRALGDICSWKEDNTTPDQVRHVLQAYLSDISRQQVLCLLEVADQYGTAEDLVANILNLCSFAGQELSDIFNDRNVSLDLRKQAVYLCGRVGFLDALPAVERLVSRLQAQNQRQTQMDFLHSPPGRREEELLVFARAALEKLRRISDT